MAMNLGRVLCILLTFAIIEISHEQQKRKSPAGPLQRINLFAKRLKLKISRYVEKHGDVSLIDISEKWNSWFSDPSTKEFFELFRDTLRFFVVQTLIMIYKAGGIVNGYVMPRSKRIFSEDIEPFVHFNPYEHTGSDSVSHYIQKTLVITFCFLALPIVISMFGWIQTLLIACVMVGVHAFGGMLALYKIVLFFLSVLIVTVDLLIVYPYLIPVALLILFFYFRGDSSDDLRHEIKVLHRSIKTLNDRIDHIK